MKRFIDSLRRRFLPLGELPSAREVPASGSISVFLGDRQIGTLRKEPDEFVFEYDSAYVRAPDAVPIPAFPDLQTTYRAEKLWPFFAVRVPSVEREDVQAAMRRREIGDDDVLRLLGELSKRGVSSPYRFVPAHG